MPPLMTVAAAAIIQDRRLLVVSKKAAPGVFYLPGGKPCPGETVYQALIRELKEELGVRPTRTTLLATFNAMAALELVPMRLTVFSATLTHIPRPAAELAGLAWTTGTDRYLSLLAPAVRNQVIPLLRRAGQMRLYLAHPAWAPQNRLPPASSPGEPGCTPS